MTRLHFKPLKGEVVIASPAHRIMREVAEAHDITVQDLLSQNRCPKYSWPRQEAMLRMRDETNLSYTQIARLLRRECHTTVMYGVRAASKRIQEGKQ